MPAGNTGNNRGRIMGRVASGLGGNLAALTSGRDSHTARSSRRSDQLERQAALRKWQFHYGQSLAYQALYHEHYRIVSLIAGTGGGKTWAAPRLLYPILREGLDKTYLFTEPTWRMVKRIMLREVVPFLDAFNMGSMHLGDMVYNLRDGGCIYFGSVDNPNSLQGAHISGAIWPDEVGLYSLDAWEVIQQRAAFHKAPIIPTTTPYTLPWVEDALAKPALPGGPFSDQYRLIQFPSWWNPAYPDEEYWRLKRLWPADKFDRLMNGQFTRISGLVYDQFDPARNVATITPRPDLGDNVLWFRHPQECPQGREVYLSRVRGAQDWGWTDPACQLIGGYDAENRLYVFAEDYEPFLPVIKADGIWPGDEAAPDTWTKRALYHHDRWNLEGFYCDPEDPGHIASMVEAGVPAVKANNSHQYGVPEVNAAMMPRGDGSVGLYIGSNCVDLIRTIGSLVRRKIPGSEQYDIKQADGQEDHPPDTLRYLVAGGADAAKGRGPGVGDLPPSILGAQRQPYGSGRNGRKGRH